MLVKDVAPELEGGDGAALEGSGLARLGEAGHLLVVEPVAQPLLGQVLALQVLPEGQPPGEEHARHLGGGLPHLGVERLLAFHHQHREIRTVPPEQDRRRRAAEGATEDDHVEISHRHGSDSPSENPSAV